MMAASTDPAPHRPPTSRVAFGQAVLAAGFAALLSQILIFRELYVTFAGNELTSGIILAVWLVGAGAGSIVTGRLIRRRWVGVPPMALVQLGIGAAAFYGVYGARMAKAWAGLQPWDLVSPQTAAWMAAIAAGPVSLLVGAQFALAAAVAERHLERTAGWVYALEAFGAVAAGLLAATPALFAADQLYYAQALAVLAAVSAAVLGASGRARPALAAAALLLVGSVSPVFARSAVHRSRAVLWPHGIPIAQSASPYGLLTVVEREGQRTFYQNGHIIAATPPGRAADEIAHIAMLSHPEPHRVLLFGGVIGGVLTNLLQHPVQQASVVEIDRRLIALAREHAEELERQALSDPRVAVETADPCAYVRGDVGPFDVIVVVPPEPTSLLASRFYTREFVLGLRRALAPGGLVAIALPGSEAYISDEAAQIASAAGLWAEASLPLDRLLLPGDPALLLLSVSSGRTPAALPTDGLALADAMDARGIVPHYITGFDLDLRFDPERIADALHAVASVEPPVSTQSHPGVILPGLRLWARQLGGGAGQWAQLDLRRVGLSALIAALAIVAASVALRLAPRTARAAGPYAAVACLGFASMAFEIALIFLYQTVYGAAYQAIALLAALFMGGMAFGAHWATRRDTHPGRHAFFASVGACAIALAVAVLVRPGPMEHWASGLGGHLVLGIPMALLGGVAGAVFPWSARLAGTGGACAGTLYGLDLLGAAAGGVLTSVVLVPAIGAGATGLLLAAICFSPAILLLGRD